jgi:hypothetical protein
MAYLTLFLLIHFKKLNMKKIIIACAFISGLAFATPKTVNATDCHAMVITCPDGTQHNIIYCDAKDYWTWQELLCGVSIS